MADPSDVPMKSYSPHFAADLLKGKVAVVTGGGSGIGFRLTEMLMRHGADAAICSRKLDRVRAAASRLEAVVPGRRCIAAAADVRNFDSVKGVVDAAVAEFGRLDILINCAAGNFLCPAASMSSNAFRTVMEIDTIGSFNASKAAFEAYFKDHGGVILNVTATLDFKGDTLQLHAGCAKAAINAMTRHMANEWGSLGIRVNSLAPGPIGDTEGFRKLGGMLDEAVRDKFWREAVPLARVGTRREMGDAALFLCSDAAAYVSGALLVADGGAWFRSPRESFGGSEAGPRSKL